MPGIDVKMMGYGDRVPAQDRYNSEESLEDNQSTTSSLESRQSDFSRKDNEFIPTRTSGILSNKPAANPNQFTRINSNPLLISAQKQMLLVEEVKKKKVEVKVGDDTPEWQSNLDGWKSRRRKQSEDAIVRVSEMKRVEEQEMENGGKRKSIGRKISLQIHNDDAIDFDELLPEPPLANDTLPSVQPKEEAEEITGKKTSSPLEELTIKKHSSTLEELTVKNQASPRNSLSSGVSPRRESRGLSQEKVILEEPELEENTVFEEDPEEGAEEKLEEEEKPVQTNPYESAIEGYKSFAKSQLTSHAPPSDVQPEKQSVTSVTKTFQSSSSRESSVYRSSSSSALPSPSSLHTPVISKQEQQKEEEKIEILEQSVRRGSNDISDKIKMKLASFQDQQQIPNKEPTPTRTIRPDNKFKDKLNTFKTIEESGSTAPNLPRRESEPALRPRGMPIFKSSSSSFINTFQNNKFFQENSLGSEQDDDSMDNQLVEDALEESFSVLEDSKEDSKEKLVFSADDFVPTTGKLAPPQEKPPPLPAVPPPPLPPQEYQSEEESDIDKQEREIIESLEREEKEHKTYLTNINGGVNDPTQNARSTDSSHISEELSQPSKNLHFSQPTVATQIIQSTMSSQSSQSTMSSLSSQSSISAQSSPLTMSIQSSPMVMSQQSSPLDKSTHSSPMTTPSQASPMTMSSQTSQSTMFNSVIHQQTDELNGEVWAQRGTNNAEQGENVGPALQPRKKDKGEAKSDYNKHWLIQEAEQRRISEAQQKPNLNIQNSNSSGPDLIEKIEYTNNNTINSNGDVHMMDKRASNVSENIYANVDPSNLNYNINNSTPYIPEPGTNIAQLPGPQVPPRLPPPGQVSEAGQDRVLSVSGKKKCSHCKEELGRGAAMIIESLRLFYHIRCFKCCVCSIQLGNGEQGTDVRVRNNRLHCQNCYSNDEGLKFSKV